MSQIPVDQRSKQTTRDELWSAIRRLKEFTFAQVRLETNCSFSTVKEYLAGLTAAGYLELHPEKLYTLERDIGVNAPHVRKDGSECVQGKGREQIWTVLPILKEFSIREVRVHASTELVPLSHGTVKEYLRFLYKSGYLVVARESRPGHKHGTGQQRRYRFVQSKYTGPKPPMIQKSKQVFDANTGQVVWKREAFSKA